jgi:hypothetical protein
MILLTQAQNENEKFNRRSHGNCESISTGAVMRVIAGFFILSVFFSAAVP